MKKRTKVVLACSAAAGLVACLAAYVVCKGITKAIEAAGDSVQPYGGVTIPPK